VKGPEGAERRKGPQRKLSPNVSAVSRARLVASRCAGSVPLATRRRFAIAHIHPRGSAARRAQEALPMVLVSRASRPRPCLPLLRRARWDAIAPQCGAMAAGPCSWAGCPCQSQLSEILAQKRSRAAGRHRLYFRTSHQVTRRPQRGRSLRQHFRGCSGRRPRLITVVSCSASSSEDGGNSCRA
jgi:hypothetical protein